MVDDSPTIRRVVSAIHERAGHEPALASGGEGAYAVLSSGEVTADLVLLDFVMPRMNGYRFCRAIRAHATLSAMPLVLMSAKGDCTREQLVQQTGALDAITKPFDAQALVAVVENALRRGKEPAKLSSSARLPEIESQEAVVTDASAKRRANAARMVASKVAQFATEAIAEKAHDFTAALAARLEREGIAELLDAAHEIEGPNENTVLSGHLTAMSIGAVLQLLQAENQSGVLVCHDGTTEVRATFWKGLIDLVVANGTSNEFRIGRHFVEQGALTGGQVDQFLKILTDEVKPPASQVLKRGNFSGSLTVREDPHAHVTLPASPRSLELAASRKPSLFGTAMLVAGRVKAAQLTSALSAQLSELLYDMIRWPRGRFDFRREPSAEAANEAKLGLPIALLVMKGFRRVDKWRVLERTLGDFDAVLVRDDLAFGSFDVGTLPERERLVLDTAVGERTIRQIIGKRHLSIFDACRILVQHLEARVLRRAHVRP